MSFGVASVLMWAPVVSKEAKCPLVCFRDCVGCCTIGGKKVSIGLVTALAMAAVVSDGTKYSLIWFPCWCGFL